MQGARNKDACEAKRQSIDQKAEETCAWRRARSGRDWPEIAAQLALMRQKREGCSRRPHRLPGRPAWKSGGGARSCFQRIDRLMPTWRPRAID